MKTFRLITIGLLLVASAMHNFVAGQNMQMYYSGVYGGGTTGNIPPAIENARIYNAYLYNFSGTTTTLTSITFSVGGTYASTDIKSFKLWVSNNNNFDTNVTLLSTLAGVNPASSGAIGNLTFTGLQHNINSYYENNKIYYFFLTVDLEESATLSSTILTYRVADYTIAQNSVYNAATNNGYTYTISSPSTGYISNWTYSNISGSPGIASTDYLIGFYTNFTQGQVPFKSLEIPFINTTLTGSGKLADFNLYYYDYYFGGKLIATTSLFPSDNSLIFNPEIPTPLNPYSGGGYMYVTASFTDDIPVNTIINLDTFSGANLDLGSSTFTGTFTYKPVITINSPNIQFYDNDIPSGNAGLITDNLIYRSRLYSSNASYISEGFTFTTGGNYTSNDVSTFSLWSRTSYSFDNDASYKLATITATGAGETLNFNGFRKQFNQYNNNYLFVTADVKPTATEGKTLKVNPLNLSTDIDLLAGTITGTSAFTGTFSIQAPTVSISSPSIAPSVLSIGTNENPIYLLKLDSKNAKAILKNVTLAFNGNFTSSDINYVSLYAGTTNSFENADNYSSINLYTPGESILFSNLNIEIPQNETRYLFVSVYLRDGATEGNDINVSAPALSNFEFENPKTVKTGNSGAGNTHTFGLPQVSFVTKKLPNGLLKKNTDANPIYLIEVDVKNTKTSISALNLSISGTYTSSDIEYYYAYRVYLSKDKVFDTGNDTWIRYQYGSNSSGSGENITTGVWDYKYLPKGKSYIFLTVDISNGATKGRTIKVTPNASSILNFNIISPTGTLLDGGVFTIEQPVLDYKGFKPTVADKYLNPGFTNQSIYTIELSPKNFDSYLNSVSFSVGGTYTTSDINRFYAYLSDSKEFDPNSNNSSTYQSSIVSGSTSTLYLSGNIPLGTTKYIHIVPRVTSSPSLGQTVMITSITGITLNEGTVTGSYEATDAFEINRVADVSTIPLTNILLTPNTSGNILYRFKVNPRSAITLNKLIFSLGGTFLPSQISSFGLNYSTSSDDPELSSNFGASYNFSTIGGNNLTLSGINYAINNSNIYYFFITANIANTTVLGQTIQAVPLSVNNSIILQAGSVTGTLLSGAINVITIPSVSISTPALPQINLAADDSQYPIYKIEVNSSGKANINQLVITATGTYTNANIDYFRLYSSSVDDFSQVSSIAIYYSIKNSSTLAGENIPFTFSYTIPAGKSYLYLAAHTLLTTLTGANIKINALSIGGIALQKGQISGSSTDGNTYVFSSPSVNISKLAAASPYIGKYEYNTIYTIKLNVQITKATINSVRFKTKGNYSSSYLTDFRIFSGKTPSFIANNSSYIWNATTVSTGTGESFSASFSPVSLNQGDNYLYITCYSSNPPTGNTIGVESVTLTSSDFGVNTSVIGSLLEGELLTVQGANVNIYSRAIYGSEKINLGTTSKPIYAFVTSVSGGNAYLYYVGLYVKGNYKPGDFSKMKLWVSDSPSFDNSAVSITEVNPSIANEYLYFYSYINLSEGIHYLYLTQDVSSTATIGKTIQISNISSPYIPYQNSLVYNSTEGGAFTTGVPSNENSLFSYTLPNQVGPTSFLNNLVTVTVPVGTDITSIAGTYGISPYAKAFVGTTQQQNGVSLNNFSSTLTFIVESETGLRQNYQINVGFIDVPLPTVTGIAINEISKNNISIYPNPTSGLLSFSNNASTKIEISDLIGTKLLVSTSINGTFDLSNLAEGIYFIKYKQAAVTGIKKIIITR